MKSKASLMRSLDGQGFFDRPLAEELGGVGSAFQALKQSRKEIDFQLVHVDFSYDAQHGSHVHAFVRVGDNQIRGFAHQEVVPFTVEGIMALIRKAIEEALRGV